MHAVAYYRVSTQQQGASGLGLEAQQHAVQQHAGRSGLTLLAEFTEVESGKRSDRPELAKALALARRKGATLVVAKLDRLSRNMAFLATLMESKVEVVACDNPTANRLTLHILAAVAEDEARRISERTKAALAAYKARGGSLGAARPECRNMTPEAARRGSEASKGLARQRDRLAFGPHPVQQWRKDGLTLDQIAQRLNEAGSLTSNELPWGKVQVHRALRRASSDS